MAVVRRRSPALNVCSVSGILRRSSAAFFSTSVLAPLLLSALILFLFRYATLCLTFQYSSFVKNDPSIQSLISPPPPSSPLSLFSAPDIINGTHYSFQNYPQHLDDHNLDKNAGRVVLYYVFLFLFGSQVYFRLYSALHPTALIAVAASHYLNKPALLPHPASVIATVRLGARLGYNFLFPVFLALWLLTRVTLIVVFLRFTFPFINDDVHSDVERAGAKMEIRMAPFTAPFGAVSDAGFSDSVLVWGILDSTLSVAWVLVPWGLLFRYDGAVERRRVKDLVDVVKQGFYLLWSMPFQALAIKIMEAVACGELGRRGLVMVGCGSGLFVAAVQSVFEAYFVVVWLVFYLAARCRDAESKGRTFGVQDLEDCLARLR